MRTRDVIWYLWLSFHSDPASDDSGIVTPPARGSGSDTASQSVKTLRQGQSRGDNNWVICVYYLFTQQSSENMVPSPAARFQHLENNQQTIGLCDKLIFSGIVMMSNILRFLSMYDVKIWSDHRVKCCMDHGQMDMSESQRGSETFMFSTL